MVPEFLDKADVTQADILKAKIVLQKMASTFPIKMFGPSSICFSKVAANAKSRLWYNAVLWLGSHYLPKTKKKSADMLQTKITQFQLKSSKAAQKTAEQMENRNKENNAAGTPLESIQDTPKRNASKMSSQPTGTVSNLKNPYTKNNSQPPLNQDAQHQKVIAAVTPAPHQVHQQLNAMVQQQLIPIPPAKNAFCILACVQVPPEDKLDISADKWLTTIFTKDFFVALKHEEPSTQLQPWMLNDTTSLILTEPDQIPTTFTKFRAYCSRVFTPKKGVTNWIKLKFSTDLSMEIFFSRQNKPLEEWFGERPYGKVRTFLVTVQDSDGMEEVGKLSSLISTPTQKESTVRYRLSH
jgi:hypothetical protein